MNPLLLLERLSQTARAMLDSSPNLPEVEARDPEPVAVAIETARALYRTGERQDALRWLRRAAERAEESGDDVRAVQLARSAADLSTELQSLAPPPSASPSPSPSIPAPPRSFSPEPPPVSRRGDEAAALAPYDDFSDKTIVDRASPPVVRESMPSGVQITDLLEPPTPSAPRTDTMPSPSTDELSGTHDLPVPAARARPALCHALRVIVTPDPGNDGAWLVRPLVEGSVAPPDAEEALLVSLQPESGWLASLLSSERA